jgi:hypothetical protein
MYNPNTINVNGAVVAQYIQKLADTSDVEPAALRKSKKVVEKSAWYEVED